MRGGEGWYHRVEEEGGRGGEGWSHREEEEGEGWSHRVEEEGEGERGGATMRRKRERGRGDYICLLLSGHLAVIANDLLISLSPLFS